MTMKNKLFWLMLAASIICGCNNRKNDIAGHKYANPEELVELDITYALDGDTIRHTKMDYIEFDSIPDLTGFFASLTARYPIAKWIDENDGINETVADCIEQIDSFRKGEKHFFPDSIVSHCIRAMGFNIAITYNHSSEMTDFVLAEWVMMCAAYYSPDITCLVEAQTPDHNAGYYNFGEAYNGAPWWTYLFLKREKGYQAICLGDFVKVLSIFQLSDQEDRKYYLCSNNLTKIGFNQWLFWAKDDGTYFAFAEQHEAPCDCEPDFSTYYFDQKQLIWKYAREDSATGKLIAVDEKPALRLVLDGEKSRFIK
jgi:hypothetical protein